jgi:hypothetical protein
LLKNYQSPLGIKQLKGWVALLPIDENKAICAYDWSRLQLGYNF